MSIADSIVDANKEKEKLAYKLPVLSILNVYGTSNLWSSSGLMVVKSMVCTARWKLSSDVSGKNPM